jgi:hypothetical protein
MMITMKAVVLTLLLTNSAMALNARHESSTTASYVTANAQCTDCHVFGNDGNAAIGKSWAASGHGDVYSFAWNSHDFKLKNGCVQCHTTTGFIAYSSGRVTTAWGSPSDTTREVLACNGCHTDVANGSLRAPVTVRPYLNDSYRNQDAGPSNLCAGCHSGNVSGRSIKSLSNVDTKFDGSHLSAATGILYKSIGYEFNGRDYSNKVHFKHDRIGISNFTAYGFSTGNQGPCIACHMSSADKHSFSPVTKDASGVVTELTSTVCARCHTTPATLDAVRMNNRKTRFSASLLALQKVLADKGINYLVDRPPYFYNNAHLEYSSWVSADTLGAAFNLHLLSNEPGAYAHNMVYAKRLIYDSIDFLDDSTFNNSVSATIRALTTLNETQKTDALGYLVVGGTRP